MDINLYIHIFLPFLLIGHSSQSDKEKSNITSIFSILRSGNGFSESQGRSSYLDENDVIPSQLGSYSSSLGYAYPSSTTQWKNYYGRSPSVKMDSLSHSSHPIAMSVSLPITPSPWLYDASAKYVYGQNQIYPYDNYDDYSYFHSGKGGHGNDKTASAIASGLSLLGCLALAIPLLLIPLALALGALLSLALILTIPVPVATVTGGAGRDGSSRNLTSKIEARAFKDKFEKLIKNLPDMY